MRLDDWFLGPDERGNAATTIRPWTTGNLVEPLVHGAEYFSRLVEAVRSLGTGDLLMFTDWRGDSDQVLIEGVTLGDLLGEAAERGVNVRGLVWRSHLDQVGMSERHVAQLAGPEVGGQVAHDGAGRHSTTSPVRRGRILG